MRSHNAPAGLWAAAALPSAPTRPVADRLLAMIDDDDIHLIPAIPPPGVTLPPRKVKLSVTRATFYARAVTDPDDVARLERDPRLCVRRSLCANPAARVAWVDTVLSTAVAEGDTATVNAAVAAASTPALLATLTTSSGVRALRELAERIDAGRLSAADQAAVAAAVAVDLWQLQLDTDELWKPAALTLAALARSGDLAAVCATTPPVTGALLWRAVLVRPVDTALAALLVRHADAFAAAVSAARHPGSVQGDVVLFGVVPQHVEPDAVPVLAAAGAPVLASLLANSDVPLSGLVLDAVLAAADHTTVRALARNRLAVWSTAQADRLADGVARLAAQVDPRSPSYAPRRDTEAVAEILARGIPCSAPARFELLRNGGSYITSLWLLGRYAHQPQPAEVTAVFAHPGRALEGLSVVNHLSVWEEVRAAGLPWQHELRSTLPAMAALHESVAATHADGRASVVALVADRLGDDPEVWATFASLAPTFPGDVADAAATAAAVTG